MTRAELMSRARPVRVPKTLADLTPTENVWTVHVELQAVAHRSLDRRTAVCGVAILEWPISAEHLLMLHGVLCGAGCWAKADLAGDPPVTTETGE